MFTRKNFETRGENFCSSLKRSKIPRNKSVKRIPKNLLHRENFHVTKSAPKENSASTVRANDNRISCRRLPDTVRETVDRTRD